MYIHEQCNTTVTRRLTSLHIIACMSACTGEHEDIVNCLSAQHKYLMSESVAICLYLRINLNLQFYYRYVHSYIRIYVCISRKEGNKGVEGGRDMYM